jgi:phospholipid-binding lipoprotein MlaA
MRLTSPALESANELRRRRRLAPVLLGLITLWLMAGARAETTETTQDPLQPMNRGVYGFNKNVLDRFLLTPLAKFHNRALPRPARASVGHFLANLEEPKTLENDLLQGQFTLAGASLGRFVINSTIGIGGLLDLADAFGIPPHDEDFGQTLGLYGVGGGPHLVLPVLGASNLRDVSGKVVDAIIDPLSLIKLPGQQIYWTVGRKGVTILEERAHDVRLKLGTKETSPDPYARDRERYAAKREAAIRNDESDLDNPSFVRPPDLTPFASSPSLSALPPSAAPSIDSLAEDLLRLDLRVTRVELSGGELAVTTRAKSETAPLPCDEIWAGVDLTSLAGVSSVTITTAVAGGPALRCTKFLSAPAPSARPRPIAP